MGTVVVKMELQDKGFSAGITDNRRKAKQLGEAMKELEHTTVSSMQASSAGLRLLSGGMQNNLRAAERLISMIPGVSKVLQAAFPIAGGVALAGVFVRIGEEAFKAIHTIEQMRNVTREGLLSLTESSMRSVDSLRVQNDKLEQSIALMEHKPVNGVALALDEARLKADELAISLNRDYTSFKKLLDESKTSVLGQLIGKASGKDVQDGANNRLANIRTLGIQQQDQLDDGNTAGAADTLAKLKAAQAEARAWERQQVAMRQGKMPSPNGDMLPYSSFYGDQGQNIDSLQGFGTIVRSQQNTQKEQERNSAAVETQKKLEAAAKAAEAMQKAQAMMLKQDELAERQQNAFNKLTVNEEIQFWNDRIGAFTKGGEQFIAVNEKIYSLIASRPGLTAENKKNQANAGKSQVEGSDLLAAAQKSLVELNLQGLEKQNKAAEQYNSISARGAEIAARNKAVLDEANISIGLAQGTMSKLGAAQALAAVHGREHADALKAINEQLATQIGLINSDPKLSADDKASAVRNAQKEAGNETAALNGGYAVTQAQDKANIQGNTISGAATDALRDMVQNFNDMAATLKAVIPRTIEGLNEDIVKLISGQGKKGDFGHTLLEGGQGLLKGALQKGEGALFGALFGKGGSKAALGSTEMNPMWVRMAAVQAAASGSIPLPGGIVGSALGHIPGLSSIADWIRPFQGAFAGGGDVVANRPALIGEHGPELFTPGTSGHITPNHAMGGGGDTHHWHIDARGSNDPAAIHAAVMRAAPAIMAGAVQAVHHSKNRGPHGR